jgi:hypothetical protein
LDGEVLSGEADAGFYVIFCAEWAVYFLLIDCVGRVMLNFEEKDP